MATDILARADFTQDPYPTHERLRAEPSLFWSDAWQAWVGSRFDDVAEALAQDGSALSAVGQTTAALAHLPEAQRRELHPIDSLFSSGLLWSDPPDHDRIRGVVNKALNPRHQERLAGAVHEIIARAVAALPDDEPFDVIESLAAIVPASILAALLGIPDADIARVRTWADDLAEFMGSPRPTFGVAQVAQARVAEAREYVDWMAGKRAQDPDDGVISRLVALRSSGAMLTDDEFHATIAVLLVGGHRTTTAGIANAILALARHPDQAAQLRERPDLMPTAVEETLRFESPHQRTVRVAQRPMTIGDSVLEPGEVVALLNGAANRDPARFPGGDALDVRRSPNRHLAFSKGTHFCIGAPLARMEIAAALTSFLGRFDRFELAEEPRWLANHTLRVPTALRIRGWAIGRPSHVRAG